MKKSALLLFIVSFIFFSCKHEKTTVNLHGQLSNLPAGISEIQIKNKNFTTKIPVDNNGNFSKKWEVKKPDIYNIIIDNKHKLSVFLAPSYDLEIKADVNQPEDTHFTGTGAETNNFILQSNKIYQHFINTNKDLLKLPKEEFNKKIQSLQDEIKPLFETSGVDEFILNKVKSSLNKRYGLLRKQYRIAHKKSYTLEPGTESPEFDNLEQYGGGTVSMSDLRGKYLYIDVWATWCAPCKREIPYLKKLTGEFKDANIQFISISTDRYTSHKTWERMVEDKEMTGWMQLFMGKDKSFSMDYNIRSIPRFIFIDPEGKIINANAPRPSQHNQVVNMFKEAGAI